MCVIWMYDIDLLNITVVINQYFKKASGGDRTLFYG